MTLLFSVFEGIAGTHSQGRNGPVPPIWSGRAIIRIQRCIKTPTRFAFLLSQQEVQMLSRFLWPPLYISICMAMYNSGQKILSTFWSPVVPRRSKSGRGFIAYVHPYDCPTEHIGHWIIPSLYMRTCYTLKNPE